MGCLVKYLFSSFYEILKKWVVCKVIREVWGDICASRPSISKSGRMVLISSLFLNFSSSTHHVLISSWWLLALSVCWSSVLMVENWLQVGGNISLFYPCFIDIMLFLFESWSRGAHNIARRHVFSHVDISEMLLTPDHAGCLCDQISVRRQHCLIL